MSSDKQAAPRVTMQDIEDNIVSEHYFTALEGTIGANKAGTGLNIIDSVENKQGTNQFVESLAFLTFCVLVLKNGFTVTGESACVSPENFNADKGREIARENAIEKMWPLMGYHLKQQLSETH